MFREGEELVLFGGGVENASAVSLFKKDFFCLFGEGSSQFCGSTRSPPTVSARTHLIGPHAYNFSTNQSDAYTFSTWPISGLQKQHRPIPGLQIQHGGILLVAGCCNVTYRYSLHPSNKTRVGGESCFQDK